MSDFRYILIDRNGAKLVANPLPTGWDNPTIELKRDAEWHGLFFDYGLDLLTFTGEAADLIMSEYREYGVNGQINVRVEYMCSPNGLYDTLYEGKIAFDSRYKELCGQECNVTVALEDSNDVMLFRNNYEQKVDLNNNIAFDKTTELTNYQGINFGMPVPGRGLPLHTSGESITGPMSIYPIEMVWQGLGGAEYIRPSYTQNQIAELAVSDLPGNNQYAVSPQGDPPTHPTGISPILELESQPTCGSGVVDYSVRIKGRFQESANANRTVSLQIVVTNSPTYNDTLDPALGKVNLLTVVNYTSGNGPDINFDESFSGQAVMNEGHTFNVFLFYVVTFNASLRTSYVYVDWDEATMVSLSAVSQCAPTTTKMYMINEAASRVSEAITNNQVKFFSSIFGRTDSQPYSLTTDPCQGMFGITSGLNIRRKLLQDGTQPGFFVSMKDIFDGLNPIWNIGLCLEPDPNRPGYKRLRFEDYAYFYRNEVGLAFNLANSIEKSIDASRIFNRVVVGYNKWEAEQFTGLDEFMTKRTYRLDINSLSAEKNLTTDIICSPYTIEITRRLEATTEDWKYDNDIFGFCMRKSDFPIFGAPDVQVETFADGTVGVENILDHETCYNGRVSPLRMAMRWFNSLLQGLRQITSATSLIFTSGEGNYIAKYKLNNCDIVGPPVREDDDVDITDFAVPTQAQPIVFPELDVFDHPMNYQTFKRLKDDPTLMFKSVRYKCGLEVREGWIKQISYQLVAGMAEVTIIPKNDLQIPIPEPPCQAMIQEGSLSFTLTDAVTGTYSVDFTEQVAGGDNWSYEIVNLDDPLITYQGNTNTHPFSISGFTESGTYSVTIIPYCGTKIGQNVVTGSFSVQEQLTVQLTAQLVGASTLEYRMRLTATGNVPSQNGFSFKFGQCVTNTSSNIQYCRGFVGSINPSNYATLNMPIGGTVESQDSTENTAGPSFGKIDKIVIYDLVGITQAQITKAAGQTWTLVFQ